MPRHYIPTPPRCPLVCRCGATYQPASKGPLPTACPACAGLQDRFRKAVAVVSECLASPTFATPSYQRDGEILMALGRRLRKGERGLVDLDDALEVIDAVAGRMDVPDAGRVARRLNAARERIAVRAGLRRRGAPRIEGGP